MTIEELELLVNDKENYLLSLPKEEFEKEWSKLIKSLEAAETLDLPEAEERARILFRKLQEERKKVKKSDSTKGEPEEQDELGL